MKGNAPQVAPDYSKMFVMQNGKPVHVSEAISAPQQQYQPVYQNMYAQQQQQQPQYSTHYGNNANYGQQQQQQQQSYDYGNQYDQYSEDDYSEDGYDNYQPGYGENQQLSQQQGGSNLNSNNTQVTQNVVSNISPSEMASSTNVQFDEVTYAGKKVFKGRDFWSKEGKFLANGEITLSMGNGLHLVSRKTVKSLKGTNATSSNVTTNSNTVSKKGSDLVKDIHMSISSNYEKDFYFGFPTIDALETEEFSTVHVSHYIPANTFNQKINNRIEASINRNVTQGMIEFSNLYALTSPADIKGDIIDLKNGTVLVNFERDTNPLIHFLNKDQTLESNKITKHSQGLHETGQVVLHKDIAMYYAEKAEKVISGNMSLGDVSSHPVIKIQALQHQHQDGKVHKKNKPFFGLADFRHELAQQSHLKTESERKAFYDACLDRVYTIDFVVTFKYLKLGEIKSKLGNNNKRT